jgi:hypothetical protein
LAWAALAALAFTAAHADDEAPLSFAFAAQAGSGIYSIEGRVVQIYRIPIDVTIVPIEGDRIWGLNLSFPATLGFYDYEAQDVLQGDFPSNVGTASVLAGVRFPVRVKPNWMLYPHADAGAAKDFSGGSLVWTYDAGAKSVVSFPAGNWDGRVGQELLWAGAAQSGSPLTGWYGEANAGFEFRRALPWTSGRWQWDWGMFGVYRHYFHESTSSVVAYSSPAPRSASDHTGSVDEQTEIGFSFGTRPKMSWKVVSVPKLGLSYRFGDGVHGVRFVIGEIF